MADEYGNPTLAEQYDSLFPTGESQEAGLADSLKRARANNDRDLINSNPSYSHLDDINKAHAAKDAREAAEAARREAAEAAERAAEERAYAEASRLQEMRRDASLHGELTGMIGKLREEAKIFQTGEHAWAADHREYLPGSLISLADRDIDGAERLAEANKSPEAMAALINKIASGIVTSSDPQDAHYQAAENIKKSLEAAKKEYEKISNEADGDQSKIQAARKEYENTVAANFEQIRTAKLQSDLAYYKGLANDSNDPAVRSEAAVQAAMFENQLKTIEETDTPDKQSKLRARLDRDLSESGKLTNPEFIIENKRTIAALQATLGNPTANQQAQNAEKYLADIERGDDARGVLHAENSIEFAKKLTPTIQEHFAKQTEAAKLNGHIDPDDDVLKRIKSQEEKVLADLNNPSGTLSKQMQAALDAIKRSNSTDEQKKELRSSALVEAAKAATDRAGDYTNFATDFLNGKLPDQHVSPQQKTLLAGLAPIDVSTLVKNPHEINSVTVKENGVLEIGFVGKNMQAQKSLLVHVDPTQLENGLDFSGINNKKHKVTLLVDIDSGFGSGDNDKKLLTYGKLDGVSGVGGNHSPEDMQKLASVVRGVESADGNESVNKMAGASAHGMDQVALRQEANRMLFAAKRQAKTLETFAQAEDLQKQNDDKYAAILQKHPDLKSLASNSTGPLNVDAAERMASIMPKMRPEDSDRNANALGGAMGGGLLGANAGAGQGQGIGGVRTV